MLRERSTFFLLPLLFIALLGQAPEVSAQDLQSYTGPYRVGDYRGQASFSYRMADGDTLLSGPFRFERSSLQALLAGTDDSFSITGTMDQGTAVGEWAFEFGEFRSDSTARVEGYAYRLNVTGQQFSAVGALESGRPDGTWILKVNRIANSEVASQLFSSQLEFERGIPQRSFRMEHPEGTLVGRFLRNGLAHDQWTLFADDAAGSGEVWVFEEGLLRRISAGGNTYPFFTGPTAPLRPINLDARYLELLEHLSPAGSSGIRNLAIRGLLAENAAYYAKLDSLLSDLGDARFQPQFKVLVPHYPLDSIQRNQLDSLRVLVVRADSIGRGLREDPHLNILRRSDQQVTTLMAATDTLAAQYIKPLLSLIALEDKGLLEFIPAAQRHASLWPDGFPDGAVELGALQAADPPDLPFDPGSTQGPESIMAGQLALSKYTLNVLEAIQGTLGRRVEAERNQDELLALEARMVDYAEQLGQLSDSLQNVGEGPVANALQALVSDAEARLADYGTLPGGAGRLEAARELAACLDRFSDLGTALAKLPEHRRQITERYSDRVWNPFTATLMDEQVKRRLTTAYHEVLVPHILNSVAAEPDCDRAQEWAKLAEDLYNRILELREEDTSRLERRLRKEREPQTVLGLLNLKAVDQDD